MGQPVQCLTDRLRGECEAGLPCRAVGSSLTAEQLSQQRSLLATAVTYSTDIREVSPAAAAGGSSCSRPSDAEEAVQPCSAFESEADRQMAAMPSDPTARTAAFATLPTPGGCGTDTATATMATTAATVVATSRMVSGGTALPASTTATTETATVPAAARRMSEGLSSPLQGMPNKAATGGAAQGPSTSLTHEAHTAASLPLLEDSRATAHRPVALIATEMRNGEERRGSAKIPLVFGQRPPLC